MSSIANDVLQEAFQDIVDLVNVDEIIPQLFAMKRITFSDFELLQNFNGSLTSHQRKIRLYIIALGGKGQQALDAFLHALDETAKNYEPHTVLADNLRTRLKTHRLDSSLPGAIPVAKRSTSTASECSVSISTPRCSNCFCFAPINVKPYHSYGPTLPSAGTKSNPQYSS